jgi:hypothetical protein
MRTTGLLLSVSFLVGACGVGDEETNTPDERLCNAQLSITGTFTMSQPAPDLVDNDTNMPPADGQPDFTGCWPTGMWKFTASIDSTTCSSPPTQPATEYQFVTTYMQGSDGAGGEYDYQLVAPSLQVGEYRLKVSSGGGGLCEGVMELYLDGAKKAWLLHPALNVFNQSGPLTGVGEYGEFDEAIYP